MVDFAKMEDPAKVNVLSRTISEYTRRRSEQIKTGNITHYDVLELDTKCTVADVRHAYYHFARIFHPDRCGNCEYAWLLQDIKMAYDVLSDEYKRMLYDIKNGLYKDDVVDGVMIAMSDVMKQKYLIFLQEKTGYYLSSVQQEFQNGGLVIKRALYGDLTLISPNEISAVETINTQHLRGPYIDVTVQLQTMIQNGVLHLNSGCMSSFAYLQGFYNPLDFEQHVKDSETQLYVLYIFRNTVHEVTVRDGWPISLPMRSHRVCGKYIKGPYAVSNVDYLDF